MEIKLSVPEFKELYKSIQRRPVFYRCLIPLFYATQLMLVLSHISGVSDT